MGFVGSVEDWAIYGELVMDGEEERKKKTTKNNAKKHHFPSDCHRFAVLEKLRSH